MSLTLASRRDILYPSKLMSVSCILPLPEMSTWFISTELSFIANAPSVYFLLTSASYNNVRWFMSSFWLLFVLCSIPVNRLLVLENSSLITASWKSDVDLIYWCNPLAASPVTPARISIPSCVLTFCPTGTIMLWSMVVTACPGTILSDR